MVPVPAPKFVSVLLAEDDENDVALLQAGLARSGLAVRLLVARNGQEAVDYLAGGPLPGQPDAPARPDLLLLDITMPQLSGFEVLRWLSEHAEFKTLPVVMLSYSMLGSDRQTARLLGASEFQIKHRTIEGITAMLQDIYARYLSLKATGGMEPPSQPQPPATS